jgi:hypothetical protein
MSTKGILFLAFLALAPFTAGLSLLGCALILVNTKPHRREPVTYRPPTAHDRQIVRERQRRRKESARRRQSDKFYCRDCDHTWWNDHNNGTWAYSCPMCAKKGRWVA